MSEPTQEVVNFTKKVSFDDLPREVSSFYQKENDGKYAISLPLVKRKIELPSAVSNGQSAFNIFSSVMISPH